MNKNKERIANLRAVLSDLREEKGLNYHTIEQELCFQKGDIDNFINAEWGKVSKSFSPYGLCIRLNIPIEDIHSGYFNDFGETKKYEVHMLRFHMNYKISELEKLKTSGDIDRLFVKGKIEGLKEALTLIDRL